MNTSIDLDHLAALVTAHVAAHRLDDAIDALTTHGTDHLESIDYWLLTAQVYLAVDQALSPTSSGHPMRLPITRDEAYHNAWTAVERVLATDPNSPQGTLMAIMVLLQREHHDDALTYAYQLTGLAPNSHVGYFYVALILSTGHVTGTELAMAHDAITTALRLDPNDADNHAVAAIIAVRDGKERVARFHVETGMSIDPANTLLMSVVPDVRGMSGIVRRQGGFFRGLLAVNPFDGDARTSLQQWIVTTVIESDVLILILMTLLAGALGFLAPWSILGWAGAVAIVGFLGWRRYRAVVEPSDPTFVKESVTCDATGRASVWLFGLAGAGAVMLSALLLLFPDARALYLTLALTVIPAFVGASLLERTRASLLTESTTVDRVTWMYRIAMDHQLVSARLYRTALALSVPVLVALTVTNHLLAAGVVLVAYGLWYLLRAGRMMLFIGRAGVRESPWMRHRYLNPSGAETRGSTLWGGVITAWTMCARLYLSLLPLVGGVAIILTAPLP